MNILYLISLVDDNKDDILDDADDDNEDDILDDADDDNEDDILDDADDDNNEYQLAIVLAEAEGDKPLKVDWSTLIASRRMRNSM